MFNLYKQYQTTLTMLMIAMFVSACGEKSEAPPAMQALPVSVLEVQATSIPIQKEAVAQTEGAREVEVRPRVGGILLKKLYEEGTEIKAGQPMFLIDPVPYQMDVQQAKARLAEQKARLVQTQREAERLKNLLETKSISQREYDNAVSDNAMASASLSQYEAALHEAELNLSYTKLEAPVGGMAERFIYSEGTLVSANTTLLTKIVQVSPIWVRFSLSDYELKELGGMLTRDTVKKITLILPNGEAFPEEGDLNFSASQIDPALGTQQLRAVFKNKDKQLVPGQFVRVRVTTGSRDGVFLVPQTAVQTGDQGKFVFVAETDKDGKTIAAIKPIQVGSWYGENWVVLDGLTQGDKVIVDNLIKVRPGAPIKPKSNSDASANETDQTESNKII
ncbi:MAG: efflux RND transporter periplasmic adaptor subunit [Methylophilaceae bacterium]